MLRAFCMRVIINIKDIGDCRMCGNGAIRIHHIIIVFEEDKE